jgi:type III secretory pathway component EscT
MNLTLSHFAAVLVFATCASVVFGITQRTAPSAMIRYGLLCWGSFVGLVIVVSWLMYFIHP